MERRDFYETLGVTRDADGTTVKAAFRKLAMRYHPDKNPGDHTAEIKFKEVSAAYECLKDPQKRAAYDRFGHAAFDGGPGPAGAGGFNFTGGFADIFDEMFGEFMGGSRSGGQRRGAELRYNMEITLEEAYHGKTTQIRVPTSVLCQDCDGSGGEKGSSPVACQACGGRGRVRAQQGFFTIERTCPSCGGAGRVIERPCRSCGGAGRVQKEKTLQVNIPVGVEDGSRIRLAGEGEAGLRGAPPGDLYIFLSIKPHRFFQRDGASIYCHVPLAMTTAALGGTIEVPTIDGSRARVKISSGAQTGQQYRLKGRGMTMLRSNARGDMYIEIAVETPVNLTKRQQELLREFEAAGKSGKTSPQSDGFFAKVKEFWEDLTE
jgi:molecular chaperone DnaJ